LYLQNRTGLQQPQVVCGFLVESLRLCIGQTNRQLYLKYSRKIKIDKERLLQELQVAFFSNKCEDEDT
jgi:hypothetical protein